jgi:hypothetical protein
LLAFGVLARVSTVLAPESLEEVASRDSRAGRLGKTLGTAILVRVDQVGRRAGDALAAVSTRHSASTLSRGEKVGEAGREEVLAVVVDLVKHIVHNTGGERSERTASGAERLIGSF